MQIHSKSTGAWDTKLVITSMGMGFCLACLLIISSWKETKCLPSIFFLSHAGSSSLLLASHCRYFAWAASCFVEMFLRVTLYIFLNLPDLSIVTIPSRNEDCLSFLDLLILKQHSPHAICQKEWRPLLESMKLCTKARVGTVCLLSLLDTKLNQEFCSESWIVGLG